MKKRLKRVFSKKKITFVFLAFMTVLLGFVWLKQLGINNDKTSEVVIPPEITAILGVQAMNVRESLYAELIERLGPVEAQEALFRSGLPFDGETHLLNHTVGDWLYEHNGMKGLVLCKDYFLSSCYHGFLIRVIGKGDLDRLSEVMDECEKVGYATIIQCSHAIGHGLLAFVSYVNLPQALEECDNVAKKEEDFPVFNCYDGVFMENNFAIHDTGKPSPDQWIRQDDPTFPCFDSRIAEKYRNACWSNQPQVMYRLFKGDVTKIVPYCEALINEEYKRTCFDSIARQLLSETGGDIPATLRACDKMPAEWRDSCLSSVAASYFTIGDRKAPFELCETMLGKGRNECFMRLQSLFQYYISDIPTRRFACQFIPPESRDAFCSSVYPD